MERKTFIEDMECKTFICYRGRTVGFDVGEQISRNVFNAIKDVSDLIPVFHAGVLSETAEFYYNFIKDAEPLIKNVQYFVVILSSGFFEGFFDKNGEKNPESATCKELEAAFDHNRNIIPILSPEFSWEKIDSTLMDQLIKAFGEGNISKLKHQSNSLQWKINGVEKDIIIQHIISKSLLSSEKMELTGKKENDKQETLAQIYKMIIERAIKLPLDNLEMDEDAYKSLVGEHKDLYFIPSGYINGVRALQDGKTPCQGVGYEKNREQSGLSKVKEYYYWQIKCDTTQEKPVNISVCAVCFGALILQRLAGESPKIQKAVLANLYGVNIQKYVDGSIALLLTLRDYEDFFWMSSWDSDSKGYAGTLNQTTLCVSALLRYGFLQGNNIDNKKLQFQFDYIYGSIHFLLKKDNQVTPSHQRYWVTNGPYGSTISYAQTCFCFNVLLKYYLCIQKALPRFTKKYKKKMDEESYEVRKALRQIINSFREWSDSWYSSDINKTECVTNLSRILSSLTGFYKVCIDSQNNLTFGEEAGVKELIKRILEMLLEVNVEYFETMSQEELFEEFPYIPPKRHRLTFEEGYERYENCSELLYLIAIMSACEIVDSALQKRIRGKVDTVLNWFESKYVQFKNGQRLIKSKREPSDDLEYPLYYIYYYHMVISDYIRLWGENNENHDVEYRKSI